LTKVVIIGAGSGFGGLLSLDILGCEALQDATIGLCDIEPTRLEAVHRYVQRAVDHHGLPARIESNTDRTELLPDADFVVTSITVAEGGAYWGPTYRDDIGIPRRFGIEQSVADTIGPGGVFRALRTGPVQLAICRDIERYCPNALLLNYTNPMAMLTWMHSVGSSVANVGLCHSVQHTTRQLAEYAGLDYERVSYHVAGINHQAWVLRYEVDRRDAYPQLRAAMADADVFGRDSVRFDLMKHFGYFVTESTRHNSEYLPYFRRTEALRERYGLDLRDVPMEPRRKRAWLADTGGGEDEPETPQLRRSHEYASRIMEAVVTNRPFAFNGNVMNEGLIDNLPDGCCVEVPCLVDARGVQPTHVGPLPPQCAALNRTNIAVQELTAKAVLERDREAAYHALAVDPLTAASLGLDEIRELFEAMWQANAAFLRYFDDPEASPEQTSRNLIGV
jgi:alpha-galactosidase